MHQVTQIDATMTINEVVGRYPITLPVFNRFAMDTCCGGRLTVDEAARRHGMEVNVVMAELHAVTVSPLIREATGRAATS